MHSDFKNISVVPIGEEFVDHVFSGDHRQKPTNRLKFNHLRRFYTRKVKNTYLSFHHKLTTILDEFPPLDGIHPFFTDLLRSIFDRDRYKSALCQVDTARHQINGIADDYVRLLEFGTSLKQCKSLKANMYSVINEITPSLAYLEQLRQHMVRLPSIDLNLPTLLISGYPNVDKTCFINRINTQAGEFATKPGVFAVYHTDFEDLRYQVIDAPGILDKPTFGDCNVITALASHLKAALVLFFMDVSGSCGYSIAYQAALFYNIKSLFVSKRLLIVVDEIDLMQVSEQDWKLIEQMGANEEEVVLKISNLKAEEGMMSVKKAACESLLDHRERPSFIARNIYILAHQELEEDVSPRNLDDDHKVRLEESEHEEGLNQSEEDDFVMAEERFIEEHKDQKLVAIRKIHPLRVLIALAFVILVGNTYGAIQQLFFCFLVK